jgi:hypothetical protein
LETRTLRFQTHPGSREAAIAAGKRVSHKLTGARVATGAINFTGQPAANDTFTINGVVFTAKAAGAAGNQFNIGVDLTTSITNLVTVLNASVDPKVSVATYANSGGTALSVTYDTKDYVGNAFTLAETSANATVSNATLTGGAGVEPILLDAETYALVTLAGQPMSFALPNGEEAQEVTLYLNTRGSSPAAAIVSGTFQGGTTLTFAAVGNFVRLKWLGAQWAILSNSSVTVA